MNVQRLKDIIQRFDDCRYISLKEASANMDANSLGLVTRFILNLSSIFYSLVQFCEDTADTVSQQLDIYRNEIQELKHQNRDIPRMKSHIKGIEERNAMLESTGAQRIQQLEARCEEYIRYTEALHLRNEELSLQCEETPAQRDFHDQWISQYRTMARPYMELYDETKQMQQRLKKCNGERLAEAAKYDILKTHIQCALNEDKDTVVQKDSIQALLDDPIIQREMNGVLESAEFIDFENIPIRVSGCTGEKDILIWPSNAGIVVTHPRLDLKDDLIEWWELFKAWGCYSKLKKTSLKELAQEIHDKLEQE